MNFPERTILFDFHDYLVFEQKLNESGRSWSLYIQGREVVPVGERSGKSRDERLLVGKFTKRNLPHFEGLVAKINQTAIDYEQNISRV